MALKRIRTSTDGSALKADEIAENFSDLHPPLGPAQAVVDAGRCLYCYDAPCVNACPTGIDIPTFIHQIRTGNLDGSARTILSANIMGGTCARACPTEILCEEACVVNRTEGVPVKIGLLQRHAVDHLLARGGGHPFTRASDSGRRLAVIGAGPAGLSFAHRASMLGHRVTVFEARPKPGGLNEYGLAAYKMVDGFAQREVEFLLGIGGIEIRYGAALGVGLTLDGLRRDFDAVFIGTGLARSATLGVPGESLPGVRDALDFIEEVRQAGDKSRLATFIGAGGRNVVVIGGGNTAIDAAIQAKCLGAQNVTLAYRRGRAQMGATGWEQDFASANGVVIRCWAAPAALTGGGAVEAVLFNETTLENGALKTTGETFLLPADLVLKAIGQKLDQLPDTDALQGLKVERGKIWVDDRLQTSLPGVFAGGDCIDRGEDLTVQAVEDGKCAAINVDADLRATAGGTLQRAASQGAGR